MTPRRKTPYPELRIEGERAEHEKGVINSFIDSRCRNRYSELLLNPRRRADIRRELAHFGQLAPECVRRIPSSQQHPAIILKLLTDLGAPTKCWLISERDELDGQNMPLNEALNEVVGFGMGTIISCVPGKLGYFEDEDQRFILLKSTEGRK